MKCKHQLPNCIYFSVLPLHMPLLQVPFMLQQLYSLAIKWHKCNSRNAIVLSCHLMFVTCSQKCTCWCSRIQFVDVLSVSSAACLIKISKSYELLLLFLLCIHYVPWSCSWKGQCITAFTCICLGENHAHLKSANAETTVLLERLSYSLILLHLGWRLWKYSTIFYSLAHLQRGERKFLLLSSTKWYI